jgi:hypothetical protein
MTMLRDHGVPSIGLLANDQERRSRVLEEEAGNASQGQVGAPAAAMSRQNDEVRPLLADAAQEPKSDIVIIGQDGARAQTLASQASTDQGKIALSHSGVSPDQASLELQLFRIQGNRTRELGHWDDVGDDQLGTVHASKTSDHR